MRLGLMLSGSRPADEAVEVACRAEQAGVAEVWVSEDYFKRGAFALAGAVAAATTRTCIGLGVLNPWTRHPMLTAMEAAALAELAPGRLLLGMGASNRVWMEDRCGLTFRRPLAALGESVEILRAALAGTPVRHQGEHFHIDAQLSFTPPRNPVPVYIGAKGRNALELSAHLADGVLLSLLSSPAYVAWARDLVGASTDLASYVLIGCHEELHLARDAVRDDIAFFLGVHGQHDITRIAGLPAERAGQFRQAWLAGEPAVHLVDDDLIDTFALAGDLEACRRGLQRLEAVGLDCAVLCDPGGPGVDGVLDLVAATRHGNAASRP